MIVRRRGDDMRAQPHWRPSTAGVTAPVYADTKFDPEPDDRREDGAGELVLEERSDAPRRSRMPTAIAALVLVAVIAGQQRARSAPPAATALPATPHAWVDSWMAASVDNPERVCKQLFSPAHAAALGADTGHSCTAYDRSIHTTPLHIERILQDGPTATVEAHRLGGPSKSGNLTIVLSHIRSGWQAVDIVAGPTSHR
jgi:hypothetical protein